MKTATLLLDLPVDDAAACIDNGFRDTATKVDDYRIPGLPCKVRVLVFDQYYFRVKARLTLVAVLDDASGETRLRATASGGGGMIFDFDWGASGSFFSALRDALEGHIVGSSEWP